MARPFRRTCRRTASAWPSASFGRAKPASAPSDDRCASRSGWSSTDRLDSGCGEQRLCAAVAGRVPYRSREAVLRVGSADERRRGTRERWCLEEQPSCTIPMSPCVAAWVTQNQCRRSRVRLFTRNRAALLAIGATLVMGSGLIGPGVSADGGSALDKANGHPALDSGKAVSHFSGALEVTFDERAEAADVQSSIGSDTPPDASASALGCANRGSLTNPRLNQDCTLRRQAEEQVTVNPTDTTNVIAGQNDSRVGFNHCGFDYSLDGGKTWGDDQPPFFQHLSQLGHTYDAASDPALTFNGAGTAWFSCVLFDVNTNASALPVVPSTA